MGRGIVQENSVANATLERLWQKGSVDHSMRGRAHGAGRTGQGARGRAHRARARAQNRALGGRCRAHLRRSSVNKSRRDAEVNSRLFSVAPERVGRLSFA